MRLSRHTLRHVLIASLILLLLSTLIFLRSASIHLFFGIRTGNVDSSLPLVYGSSTNATYFPDPESGARVLLMAYGR